MSRYSIATQKFEVVSESSQVKDALSKLVVPEYVIKAQIHAGGRGKGTFDNGYKGGVHLTTDKQEVEGICDMMLGHKLSTKQTVEGGVEVKKVMVAQALDITRETYFAILLDRAYNGAVMIASPEGGMDIEEVARVSPEKIFKEPIDSKVGLKPEQTLRLAKALEFKGNQIAEAQKQMEGLYNLFVNVDATQVEINPLGETPDGQVVCFDAKINFDDNSEFRQKEIFSQRDTAEEDPREIDAEKYGLNYVGMDGNVGCMVNGAGLAMATMDIIKLHGGNPANFLDLGGGITEANVGQALRILSQDSSVNSIFVNIFGGIVDCALVARGLVKGCTEQGIKIPITIRLKGNNEELAQEIILNSGLPMKMIQDMDKAAMNAVSI